jgi:hypothetical protein
MFDEFRDLMTDQLPINWPLAAKKFERKHIRVRQWQIGALACSNECNYWISIKHRDNDNVGIAWVQYKLLQISAGPWSEQERRKPNRLSFVTGGDGVLLSRL